MNKINSDFQKYYFEYWRLVYYAALKIVGIRETAEDVASDVFVNLYKQMLISPIPSDKVSVWLIVSAKRKSYNYIRDNKRLGPLDTEMLGNNPFLKIDERIFVSDMLNRLHRKSERWFDVVTKFYLLGRNTAELAEEYQCSEQAIRNVLQRARDYLRSEYRDTDVALLFFMLLTIRIHYILTFLDINKLFN